MTININDDDTKQNHSNKSSINVNQEGNWFDTFKMC